MVMEFSVLINMKIYDFVGNFISYQVSNVTSIYVEGEYIHSLFVQNISQCQVHKILCLNSIWGL